jgi:putative flippase GtrA
MNTVLKEAVDYQAASTCALIVDVAILWALVNFLSIGYLIAATISFTAGAAVARELSVRLAFKQHRLQDREVEFVAFVIIGGLGLAVNAAVIFAAINYAGLHYLVAKCVAAGFTFTCNFIVRRQILFVPRGTELRDQ